MEKSPNVYEQSDPATMLLLSKWRAYISRLLVTKRERGKGAKGK